LRWRQIDEDAENSDQGNYREDQGNYREHYVASAHIN
jgi:hypothetical protein